MNKKPVCVCVCVCVCCTVIKTKNTKFDEFSYSFNT